MRETTARTLVALLVVSVAAAGCGGTSSSRPAAVPEIAARATAHGVALRTAAAAVAARSDVPVLCYHQIRAPTAADDARARPFIIRPEVFARQMQALAQAGYRTITGEQLVAHAARGAPLPPKPVLLTFDDATEGQFTNALPVLERHRFVATFFVMTVVLDKPGWLTRPQVRTLDRAGMTIGAHTWDHRSVLQYRGGDWHAELEAPRDALAAIVGHPIRLFAYPYGRWIPAAFGHLARAAYTGAFQLSRPLDARYPLWTLRRILVPAMGGPELLAAMRQSF
jgi:peptidoglycan/xylan/chitin deacetylase (PgdA/CDA1 family)